MWRREYWNRKEIESSADAPPTNTCDLSNHGGCLLLSWGPVWGGDILPHSTTRTLQFDLKTITFWWIGTFANIWDIWISFESNSRILILLYFFSGFRVFASLWNLLFWPWRFRKELIFLKRFYVSFRLFFQMNRVFSRERTFLVQYRNQNICFWSADETFDSFVRRQRIQKIIFTYRRLTKT